MDSNNQNHQPNPYDFITNTGTAPNKPIGGSMKSRISLVIGGVFLLLMLVWIVSTILSSGSKQAAANLKKVVAEQQEIVRTSGLGLKGAVGPDAKGYAATVNLVITTGQKEMTEQLTKQGIKLTTLELSSGFNAKTEELLTSAATNNQYDEVLTDTLNKLLEKHKKTIKTAYDTSESNSTKEALEKAYNNADILLNARSPGS